MEDDRPIGKSLWESEDLFSSSPSAPNTVCQTPSLPTFL